MKHLLELVGVSKIFRHNWTYRQIPAVEDLSLTVAAGEVFGLIGHNGAGKTTTFKMLVGLLRPTQGHLRLEGSPLDRPEARRAIGFSPEQPYFYDYLTVRETLNYFGQLYGMRSAELRGRVAELVERFHLTSKLAAPVRTLSKGNLQRVAVAQAILHRPKLAILDEPMSGLDPVGRKEMRELISSLTSEGTTVLFSSHVLSDAEALCNRVAILAQGRLREIVDLSDVDAAPLAYSLTLVDPPRQLLDSLARIATGPPHGGPSRWSIILENQVRLREALAAVQGVAVTVESVTPLRPSLEERFLRYVPSGALDG